jgi:hypothetical protein
VILILTVVGLGVAYFAQIEESLSGNARLTRAASYVAEVGLRKGETVISTMVGVGIGLTTVLTCGGCPVLNVPGGGYQGIILHATDPEDSADKDFVNQQVPVPPPLTGKVVDRGAYSIYVRNNPEDPGGATIDSDNIVLILSVGQVRGAGGRIYTKILEEQLLTGAFGAPVGGQYLTNQGGTGSGAKSK